MHNYHALFSSTKLANKTLKNRIVHASMTTRMGVNGGTTEQHLQYYKNRAIGGAGMIVTEPLSMALHQHIPYKIVAYDNSHLSDLEKWAESVESEDCRLLGQIQDPGRGRHQHGRAFNAVGASALPDDLSGTIPRVLTTVEIRQMNTQFANSSLRLKRCGFSGVEISAGHGHLFHQFLSPWSNIRHDQYGGDLVNRCRILHEMIDEIRQVCGHDFIIGLKLPGDDGVIGGINYSAAAEIANHLTINKDIDYITFAQGSHARSLEMHVPDDHEPRFTYRDLFAQLKPFINNITLMALGRITDPAEADAIIQSGQADLVALGRSLVADPAWPLKSIQGRSAEIRYCVSCNNCWYMGAAYQQKISCDNNPTVGKYNEVDYWPPKTPLRKKVVIVGSGIAALEAAWVAAAKGHSVHVFGSSPVVGGKLAIRSQLPGGESMSSIYDYQYATAMRAGVHFKLGYAAELIDITALNPQVVILACGATMAPPRWIPDDIRRGGLVPDLRSVMDEFIKKPKKQVGCAMIYDLDQTEGTYASLEYLKNYFDEVHLITPYDCIGSETSLVTRQGIQRRLSTRGITITTLTEPIWSDDIGEGYIDLKHVYTNQITRVKNLSLLTYSTPRVPNQTLLNPLLALGFEVHLIGDCLTPRNVMAATQEGYEIANII